MTLLRQRSKRLSHDLSRVIATLSEGVSEKGVHRLRTTIRRLETLFNYVEPDLGKKQQKVVFELRALRKRAGKVRDLDIQIGLLDSIGNRSAATDRRALLEALKKKRAKQVDRLTTATEKLESSKFFGHLARITGNTATQQRQDSVAPLQRVRQELSQLAADSSSSQILKPDRLHELRIKLKLLRYQAELAEKTPEQKDLMEQLKAVQDSIGEWHDWEMLARSAEKQFDDRMNCALLVEIRALFAARYSAANSAAASFLTDYSPAAKKRPSSVQPSRAVVQRA
jgi:CHAD domain-containing protein